MKLCIQDTPNYPSVLLADTVPQGFVDGTTIENWAKYGSKIIDRKENTGFKDWKCIQREIGTLADAIVSSDYDANWGNLNAQEQLIACEYLLSKVPPAKFAATVPDADDRTAMAIAFDENNRLARGSSHFKTGRIQVMRIYLFGKIGTADALETFRDAVKDNLLELYEGGIEGTVEDGIEGLNDFLLSRVGTTYETTGLTTRGYSIIDGSGDNLTDVANALVAIASNGQY